MARCMLEYLQVFFKCPWLSIFGNVYRFVIMSAWMCLYVSTWVPLWTCVYMFCYFLCMSAWLCDLLVYIYPCTTWPFLCVFTIPCRNQNYWLSQCFFSLWQQVSMTSLFGLCTEGSWLFSGSCFRPLLYPRSSLYSLPCVFLVESKSSSFLLLWF